MSLSTIAPEWKPLFDEYEIDIDSIYNNSVLPVYPERSNIFRVFSMKPSDICVVLLGQDPYHGPGQAHGLSFSVGTDVPIPPSLRNIFKELQTEFPERSYKFSHGNLQKWHDQGIFLLNAALTVEEGKPNSHAAIWSDFTDDVIKYIAANNKSCIFLLLGAFAQTKATFCPSERIVKGIHPSPLSAHRGFFGSNIFKSVEERLKYSIDWQN